MCNFLLLAERIQIILAGKEWCQKSIVHVYRVFKKHSQISLSETVSSKHMVSVTMRVC